MSRIFTFLICIFTLFSIFSNAYAKVNKERIYKTIRAYWKSDLVERELKRKKTEPSKYAYRIIDEVVNITNKKGNSWLSAEKFLGMATVESNLLWWEVGGGYKGNWDCGITQIAVKWLEKSYKKRWALCQKLVNSTKLAFEYAMKKLNKIKKSYCGWRYKQTDYRFDQCIFNIYNQGHRFLWNKWRYCSFKKKPGESSKHFNRRIWRCKLRNRYWLRVRCFSHMYSSGKIPRKNCRKATSLQWISWQFRKK